MRINNLHDLFENELHNIYDCELKLVKKGIPAMIESATSPELRDTLEHHLKETRNHVVRVERVFSIVGGEAKIGTDHVFDKLLDATKDSIRDSEESSLRDAALIVDANKMEHYEMAAYGTLVAYAQILGLQQAAQILQETLNEEKTADAKLTQIGKMVVNPRASLERRAA